MSNSNVEKTRQFESQGFIFIPQFLVPEELKEIETCLERFISVIVPELTRKQVFYEDPSKPESLKQIQRIHEHDVFFGKLMTDSPFRKLAEELLGSEVTCENMQYFNKPPGIGQSTPAHQDGYYFQLEPCEALTMWLALDFVDEENGCVRYVPGSHRLGMRPHGRTSTLGFSQGITDFPNNFDLAEEIAFPAAPGDLLVHHALTVHRADANQSLKRSRKALGFIYYSANAKPNMKARAKYQNELNQLLVEKQGY